MHRPDEQRRRVRARLVDAALTAIRSPPSERGPAVTTLVPYAPEIRSGTLGDQATLAGAAATGVEHARAALIRRCLS
jgi:hypothetical protein